MLSPDRVPDLAPLTHAAADYDIVRRAIAYISEHWRAQPEIEAIAQAAGVTPTVKAWHTLRRARMAANAAASARLATRDSLTVPVAAGSRNSTFNNSHS